MVSRLLELVFPPACVSCGRTGWPWCARCATGLCVLRPPLCRRCGVPTERELARCAACPSEPLDSLRAPFAYEGPVRVALHRLKFGGTSSLAAALAGAMAEAWTRAPPAEPQIVTWVPLGPGRRARRGFDQAELLASAVARRLGLPAAPLLRRVAETAPQARRGREDRAEALRGAFRDAARHARRPGGAASREILLVDDVCTTASTAGECARTLPAAGAERVHLLVAARAAAGPLPARCYTAEVPSGSVVARGRSQRRR